MKIGTFTDIALMQVKNMSIYLWGGQGQKLTDLTEQKIRQMETSTSNADKVIKMWKERKDKYPLARAFDCSGLVCWSLTECGAKDKGFDKTAEGLRQMCSKLTRSQLQSGDLCFKVSDGKAHHVGIYINGQIVEAKGRAYGVVSSALTSSWGAFGRLNIKWDEEPTKFVFTRNLKKGMKGDDVKELQKLLIAKKYNLPKYGADGDFGSETDKVLRRFQIDKNLKCDGIAGQKTITALGGEWKK